LRGGENSDKLIRQTTICLTVDIYRGGCWMSQPYIGECRMVRFNFAPAGWLICQGQIVPISENDALFNLIGTTYGGDGQSTFGIPNLQGRVPIHQGNGFTPGAIGGVEQVTLTVQQLPIHTHPLLAAGGNGNTNLLQGAVLAGSPSQIYNAIGPAPDAAMNASSITPAGGSQPHSNLQPYLTISWIISLFGIFPSQT
jgi:microcystin-dependent protein